MFGMDHMVPILQVGITTVSTPQGIIVCAAIMVVSWVSFK